MWMENGRCKFELHQTKTFQEINPDNWDCGFFGNV